MKHKIKFALVIILLLFTSNLVPTTLMAQPLSAAEILAMATESAPTSTEFVMTMSYEGWNEDTGVYAATSLSAQGVTVNGESYISYTLAAGEQTLNLSMVTDRTGMYFQGEDGIWYGQAYDAQVFTFESQLQQVNFENATVAGIDYVNGREAYIIVDQVSFGEVALMTELWIDAYEYLPLKTRMTSTDGSVGEITTEYLAWNSLSELPVRPSENFVPLTEDEYAEAKDEEALVKAQACPTRNGPYFKWFVATLIIPLTHCDIQTIDTAVSIGSSIATIIKPIVGAICGAVCEKVITAVEYILKFYTSWLKNANQACGQRGADIHVTFIPYPVVWPFVWNVMIIPTIWRIC